MRKIVELALFTEQVEAMTDFYHKAIGIEPDYADAHVAVFHIGEMTLLIHEKGEPQLGMPPNQDHFALRTATLDATTQALKAQGIQFVLEPRSYDWGRSAYLRDPDGRVLELHEEE